MSGFPSVFQSYLNYCRALRFEAALCKRTSSLVVVAMCECTWCRSLCSSVHHMGLAALMCTYVDIVSPWRTDLTTPTYDVSSRTR
eukprot:4323785-Amphidinium_carterae.2